MKWLRWFDLPLLLGFAAAIVLYAWAWDARHVIGMAVAAIGFALWFTARLQLGKSFAVRPQARALVTRGLYSKFRNPIYLFGGLAYGALLIAWGKVIPLVFFVFFYPVYQYLRVRKEAEVLEKAFGDEYRRYKARTWL
ncbi:MAG TPA: isoprenylcysteine carboxylmethyltransferase family protein [Terriglobia bacterium]|nr:isoprenylcysteine carboxylmethyltransferase family protein [Terriglobia bacterium]